MPLVDLVSPKMAMISLPILAASKITDYIEFGEDMCGFH